MHIVLPTPHKRGQNRRTPTSLAALARSTWGRPSSRDLVFTPLPFTRVFSAWLGVAVAIRLSEALRGSILAPAWGSTAAMIISTVLSIASVLAITHPFFRSYSGQWAAPLAWYGFVLAALTVLSETLYALYVQHQFGHEITGRYNVLHGQLWPFIVITVGLTPLLWARWSDS